MPVPRLQPSRPKMVVRQPLPGVRVANIAGDGPLLRGVPDHFSTALHLSGHSQWTSGQARWSSSPGTISLKVPGEVYAERARQGHPEFQVVLFDAALVDEARAALDSPILEPRARALASQDPRAQPIAELHRLFLDGKETAAALEEALCAALSTFVDMTCAPRPFKTSSVSVAVARARAMLDERITEMVALEELATHARLDKFHLCRAFHAEIGLPPHAYVTHRRVCLAQDLLARGVLQADVAAKVGFYDQSQMHRHFKRILGVTPGAYAKAIR